MDDYESRIREIWPAKLQDEAVAAFMSPSRSASHITSNSGSPLPPKPEYADLAAVGNAIFQALEKESGKLR